MKSAWSQSMRPCKGGWTHRADRFTERRTRQPLHELGQKRALTRWLLCTTIAIASSGILPGMNAQVITRPVLAAK